MRGAAAILQPLSATHMFNQLFTPHSIRTFIRVIALVIMLFVLVNIF
jgi:hypothetical protein